MENNEIQSYKKKGYLICPFKNTDTKTDFFSLLKDIQQEKLKSGFSFKSNYSSFRKDLIPNAHSYSDTFFDILSENNVKELVTHSIGADIDLINIAVVDSLPPGYMTGWHSDNFDEPIHKIIIYPCFDQPEEKRLEVLEGHVKSKNRVFYNKYIQKIEPKLFKHHVIPVYSSNNQFLFVNTQVFHRAFEVASPQGALRILYSFRKKFNNDQEKEKYIQSSATTIDDINKTVERYRALS